MTRQEIIDALNAGLQITYAGGTQWALKSPTDDIVWTGCFSDENCCENHWNSVEEFVSRGWDENPKSAYSLEAVSISEIQPFGQETETRE